MTADSGETLLSSIEESIVTIVRQATLPWLQQRVIAESGVAVERAGQALLRTVAERGTVRVTDLARLHGVDVSTVSRQVAYLVSVGLLTRAEDDADRRVSNVSCSAAGRDALEQLQAARHRVVAEILEGWPVEDRAVFAPLLARLADDLVRCGGPP